MEKSRNPASEIELKKKSDGGNSCSPPHPTQPEEPSPERGSMGAKNLHHTWEPQEALEFSPNQVLTSTLLGRRHI